MLNSNNCSQHCKYAVHQVGRLSTTDGGLGDLLLFIYLLALGRAYILGNFLRKYTTTTYGTGGIHETTKLNKRDVSVYTHSRVAREK